MREEKRWKTAPNYKKAAKIEKPLRIGQPYKIQKRTTGTEYESLRDLEKNPENRTNL